MKWTFKDFEAIVIMLLSFGTFIAVLFVFSDVGDERDSRGRSVHTHRKRYYDG